MNALFGFAKERIGSLVSKKLGAAVVAEIGAVGTPLQGVPLITYIIVQGIVDLGKLWIEKNA